MIPVYQKTKPAGLDLSVYGYPVRSVAQYQIAHDPKMVRSIGNRVSGYYHALSRDPAQRALNHQERLFLSWYKVTGHTQHDYHTLTHDAAKARWLSEQVEHRIAYPDSLLPPSRFNVPRRIDKIQ
jgi:hypothetical protein